MADSVRRLIPLRSFAHVNGTIATLIDEKGDLISPNPLYFTEEALADDVVFTTKFNGEPIHFINTYVEVDEDTFKTYHELAHTFKESGKPSFKTAAGYKLLSTSTDGKNPIGRPPQMETEPPNASSYISQ